MDIPVLGQVPDPADLAAIIALVAAVDDAQRREDADAFLSLMRDDAVWVTGGGRRLYGLPAISEFTRAVLPGATAASFASYEPDHILFVTPDVAVVNVNQRYVARDGSSPDELGSPVYVLLRESGGWRIAAAQNTPIPGEG